MGSPARRQPERVVIRFKYAFCLCFLMAVASMAAPVLPKVPRVVASYLGYHPTRYPAEDIDFSVVTHIVFGDGQGLVVFPNGTAPRQNCSANWNSQQRKAYQLARAAGRKVQVGFASNDGTFLRSLIYDGTVRGRFMASIAPALASCGVDGVEFDWEKSDGFNSTQLANDFTDFLIETKTVLDNSPSGCGHWDSPRSKCWVRTYRLSDVGRMGGKARSRHGELRTS